jgi:hypothetical protein
MQGQNHKIQSGQVFLCIILLYSFPIFFFIISPSHSHLEKQELYKITTKRMNQRANVKKKKKEKEKRNAFQRIVSQFLTEVIFRPFNMGWAGGEVGRRGDFLFAPDCRISLSAVDLFYSASHREA